jgi:hypothetical protein
MKNFKETRWKENLNLIKDGDLRRQIEENPLQTITQDNDTEETYENFLIDYSKINLELPKEFNGKEIYAKYFNDIEDQKNCGSCWAFSTVKTLEDRINIQSKIQPKINLSPAHSIICDVGAYENIVNGRISAEKETEYRKNSSCYGNTIYDGLKYLYVVGSVLDQCIPYDLKSNIYYKPLNEFQDIQDIPFCETVVGEYYDMCYNWYYEPKSPEYSGIPARFFRLSSYYKLKDEESMMKDIYLYGPIVSGFDVYDNFYTFDPKNEIYEGKGVLTGGHAIEIVGWGEENGIKYWWIKNSWGIDWGIDGYFKMIRGKNNCNIEINAWGLLPDYYYPLNEYIPEKFLNLLPKNEQDIELRNKNDLIAGGYDEYGYSKRVRKIFRELDNIDNIFNLQNIKNFYHGNREYFSYDKNYNKNYDKNNNNKYIFKMKYILYIVIVIILLYFLI